ncbi:MAG: YceI family protein [Pseudomonadota bacterium]
MKYTALLAGAAGLALIAACGNATNAPAVAQDDAAQAPAVPAEIVLADSLAEVNGGAYSLERTHAFLTWKVGHQRGISDYTVQFGDFDADLNFDPADPAASTLSVTINPASLIVNYPGDYKAGHADSGFETWAEDMARNERWLNADTHPEITFTSTDVALTSGNTGTVTGDLTFLGTTLPVTLDVTYNGVGGAPWYGERDLIGFNATTTINRSDFGMTAAIPNVSDAVTIEFSGEFLQDE